MEGNSEKRLSQRACFSAGDEIGLLILEKEKGRGRCTNILPAFLAQVAHGLAGVSARVGNWDPQETGAEG